MRSTLFFEALKGAEYMDTAAMTRMQIRVVLTVFRSEMAKLRRLYPADAGRDAAELLRRRSMEMLDNASARLNGAPSHAQLIDEIATAREEVGDERPEVSAGSRGDRRG